MTTNKIKTISVILPYHQSDYDWILDQTKLLTHFFSSQNLKPEFIISLNGIAAKNPKHTPVLPPNVKVIHCSNRGLGTAIKNAALKLKSDYYYISSPDLPFQLTDLKHMMKLKDKYHIIFGSKLNPKSTYQSQFLRKMATRIQSLLTRLILPHIKISDVNGSMFGQTHALADSITQIKANTFFFATELAHVSTTQKYQVGEVPVIYVNTGHTTTVNLVRDGLNNILQLFRLRFTNPGLGILLLPLFLLYVSPLLSSNNIAGLAGDASSNTAYLPMFCQNFYQGNFHTTQFFYPEGINWQGGYDYPLLASLACLYPSTDPVVKFNFLASVQIGLILLTSYLLAKKLLNNRWLQLSFVLAYGLSGFTIARAEQHINILSTIWAINFAYYFFSQLELARFKSTLIACLSITVACLSAWQNFPNLFLPLIILVGYALVRTPDKLKAVINLAISALICSTLMFPFLKPILLSYHQSNRIVDTQSMYVYNSDLLSFLIPHANHWSRSLYADLVAEIEQQKGAYFELIHPFDTGIILLLLYLLLKDFKSIRAFIKQNKVLLLILATNIFLSFGPYIGFAGHVLVRLPYYDTLSKYPPFSMTRTPARMAIVSLCLGYLLIFQFIEQHSLFKAKAKTFFPWLALYLLFSTTVGAKNLQYPHLHIPTFYPLQGLATIKADSQAKLVFNSPLELLNNPTQNFLQLYHAKPLVTGYVSYASLQPETQYRIKTDPLLASFGCVPHDQTQVDYVNQLTNPQTDFTKEFQSRQISYLVHYKLYPKDSRYPCPMAEYVINSIRQSSKLPIVDENNAYVIFKIPND